LNPEALLLGALHPDGELAVSERFFNNAGPVDCAKHYCLNPLQRIDLEEIEGLIEQERYFILHAPRQTGKTSTLLALMHYLNQQGRYRCVYTNVEGGQAARNDVPAAMRAILNDLGTWARQAVGDPVPGRIWSEVLAQSGAFGAFGELLARWSEQIDRPLVLLIDEIDSLIGDTLISLLRQLRAGYPKRPAAFPQTVILCGMRDVRDYRIHSSRSQEIITGGSAFNIKAESIRMGNFAEPEVTDLYRQHTEETGQVFTPAALERVWWLTRGQPWLVNALGYELTFRMKENRDRTRTIDRDAVDTAAETLIERRDTHLDQLTDKLREARVRRVIEPILAGDTEPERLPTDDVQYVEDLGLITLDGQLNIANPIYQEIIPRELIYTTSLTISHQPVWYILPDGRLDLPKMLAAFQDFFREHSEHWLARFDYQEAGPQLLMQAFLHRIVNGGGRIEREYGLGRMRTDVLVIWPHPAGVQKAVIELKLLHKSLEQTLEQGLAQTWEYLDRSAAEEAHLVIFDRRERAWEDKLFQRRETHRGQTIAVWGM
jgi:hypothetical protein